MAEEIFIIVDASSFVTHVNYFPYLAGNEPDEEAKSRGIFVQGPIPEPERIPGKAPILKYTKDQGFFHEYTDVYNDPEKIYKDLQSEMLNTQLALADLTELITK